MTRSALCSALLVLAMRALVEACPVQLDEPLTLRWLRSACDHPWRTSAAFLCLLTALRSPGQAPPGERAGRNPGTHI